MSKCCVGNLPALEVGGPASPEPIGRHHTCVLWNMRKTCWRIQIYLGSMKGIWASLGSDFATFSSFSSVLNLLNG